MKQFLLIAFILSGCAHAHNVADNAYTTKENIHYYEAPDSTDSYMDQQCLLDVYYPTNAKNFPTVIWFHAGALTYGDKEIPEALKGKGLAIIGVKYRLSPNVKAPAYIEDAAAATAWVFKHIAALGGDTANIYISGHSAGAYLASMVTLDKEYLARYHIDANRIKALISLSGQCITQYTVRQEQGLKDTDVRVDKYAPLYFARKDAPPMFMITGDREKELLGRYEECAYMQRVMKLLGNKTTTLQELPGEGHDMTKPAFPLLLKYIEETK